MIEINSKFIKKKLISLLHELNNFSNKELKKANKFYENVLMKECSIEEINEIIEAKGDFEDTTKNRILIMRFILTNSLSSKFKYFILTQNPKALEDEEECFYNLVYILCRLFTDHLSIN